jgi:hypothetical protein
VIHFPRIDIGQLMLRHSPGPRPVGISGERRQVCVLRSRRPPALRSDQMAILASKVRGSQGVCFHMRIAIYPVHGVNCILHSYIRLVGNVCRRTQYRGNSPNFCKFH